MALANLASDYNHIEPYIWYAIALLSFPALRGRTPLVERLLLFVTLVAFGTSDFYEAVAWWTPWWLLLWKALCLALSAGLIARIWRRGRCYGTSNVEQD